MQTHCARVFPNIIVLAAATCPKIPKYKFACHNVLMSLVRGEVSCELCALCDKPDSVLVISGVPEATHVLRLRALEGHCISLKSIQGSETRKLLGGTEEKSIFSMRGHGFALSSNI